MLQVWCRKACKRMDPRWSLTIVSSFHELWKTFQQNLLLTYMRNSSWLSAIMPCNLWHVTFSCLVFHCSPQILRVWKVCYLIAEHFQLHIKTLDVGSAICFIHEIIYIRIHFNSRIDSKVEIQKLQYMHMHPNNWLASLETCPTPQDNMQINHRGRFALCCHRCRMILRSCIVKHHGIPKFR